MASRPGHIYLLTDWIPAARAAGCTAEPVIRVNLNNLDLDRLATDEDRVAAQLPTAQQYAAQALPDWASLPHRQATELVGDWMNTNTAIVDQPSWVEFSMQGHTVAYRGAIELNRLEILPLWIERDWEPARQGEAYPGPSDPVAHFKGPSNFEPT